MASIQGIYLALFGRPADPAGLAYWNEQSKNGADLSKIIDVMTKAPEAVARFSGLSDAALVTGIYQALFDRAPDAAGLAFFAEQLKSGKQTIGSLAINILDGAGGNDLTLIQNREKAASAFTASLDTPAEIAAYSGTTAAEFGRSFVKTVTTDPATVPTATQVQASINTGLPSATGGQAPVDGQTPGAGGGGVATAPEVASLDASKTLVINANADATVVLSDNVLITSAVGFNNSFITATDVENITLSSGSKLHMLGTAPLNAASNLKDISGAGTLDVQGVTFTNADATLTDAKARFEPSPSLDAIYSKVARGTGFTVNGNTADTIKGIWDVLDDRYGDANYYATDINTDFVNLGLRYGDYLNNGGKPFADLIVKASNTLGAERSQSMHDNLLGNLNRTEIVSRFDGTQETDFLNRIPSDYLNRPVFSGNSGDVDGGNHNAVRFFDYAKGWERPDYGKMALHGSEGADLLQGKSNITNATVVYKGLNGNDTIKGGGGNDVLWGDDPNATGLLAANFGDDTIDGGKGTNLIVLGTKSQDIQLGGQDTVQVIRGQQGDDVIFNFNFGPTNRYDDIASGGTVGGTTPRPGTQDDLTFDILKVSGYSSQQDFLTGTTIKIGNANAAYTEKVSTVLGAGATISGNIITTVDGNIYTGPYSGSEFEIVLDFANGGSVTFANAMGRYEKFFLLKQLGLLADATGPSANGQTENDALDGLIYADQSNADPTAGLVTLTDAQETALIGILRSQGNLVLDGVAT